MRLLGSIEYTTPVKTMDVAVPLDSKKETFMNTIFHKDAGKQRTNGENLHVENDSNHVNGVESNEESGENRPSENGKGDENETKNIAESESDTITKETKKCERTEVSECKSSEENNQLNATINKDEIADTTDGESTENGPNEEVEEEKPKSMDKKEIEIIDTDKKTNLNTEEEKESTEKDSSEEANKDRSEEATKDSSGEANEDRSEEAKKDSIQEAPDDDKEDVPDIIDDHNSPQESSKPEIKDDESQATNSGISEEVLENLCESTVMEVDSEKDDKASESDIVDTSKKDIDMDSGNNDATSIEIESGKDVTSIKAESVKDKVTSMEIESGKDVSMEAESGKDVTDKEKSADKEDEIMNKRPMKTNEIFFEEAVGTNSSDDEESEVELVDKAPLKNKKEQKEDSIEVTIDEKDEEDEHRLENEALKSIQIIEDLSKSMEEFTNKSKRANQQPVGCEPQNKKQKIEETKYVSKQLKKIKRSTLETMLAAKVAEVVTNKSEIGKLRRQVDCFRESAEVWQKRADLYSKQIKDLSTVMRKYLVDSKHSTTKSREGPVRITRSVGLQVLPATMRSSHPSLRGGRGGRTALLPRQGTTPPQNSVGAAAPPQPRAILHQQKPPAQQPSQPQVKNLNLPAKLSAQQQHQPLQLDAASQRQRQLSTSPKPGITRSVQNPSRSSPVVARPVVPIKPKPPAVPPSIQPEIVELDLSDDESTPAVSPAAPPPFQPVNSVKPVTTMARPQLPAFRLQGQAPPPRFQLLHRNRATPLLRHPAPLPNEHNVIRAGLKGVPPKPSLSITKSPEGVVLSWNMVLNVLHHETVSKYQLYAYQEQERQKPDKSLWKKVGNVKALPLPMACTLKQFSQGNKYHFAVRALDMFERHGLFSDAASIQI